MTYGSWTLGLVLLGTLACSDDRASSSFQRRDPQVQRRVIEPPTGTVRPLPPYAILTDGVGPYKLGQKVAALLDKLPSGPRIARFEIPGLLHMSLIRAEDETILIGAEPTTSLSASTTSFVAVIGGDVARTEAGLHVGSTKDELAKLGPLLDDPERARDPRLAVSATLRNARLVVQEERVIAIVVTGDGSPEHDTPPVAPRETGSAEPTCLRPTPTDGKLGACLTSTGEIIEIDDDEILVRALEGSTVIARLRVPNLLFVVPLRNPIDGRDELVAIARSTDELQVRTWSIVAYRVEGTKVLRAVDPTPLYQLSSAQTRWIGADLRDVDLYLELTSRPDGIEVGGLLTTRAPQSTDKIRDVVVISQKNVQRRNRGKSATGEANDAGVPDVQPPDSRSGAGSAKL